MVTPHESWYGSKPSVDHLHIFGRAAYAHVQKAKGQKLDSKSTQCILLGYGPDQKGYHLYDLERLKVIHSQDVEFDETFVGGTQIEDEAPYQYVELEVEDCTAEEEEVSTQPNDGAVEESEGEPDEPPITASSPMTKIISCST